MSRSFHLLIFAIILLIIADVFGRSLHAAELVRMEVSPDTALTHASDAMVKAMSQTMIKNNCQVESIKGGLGQLDLAVFWVLEHGCKEQGTDIDYLYIVQPTSTGKTWYVPEKIVIGIKPEFTVRDVAFKDNGILISGVTEDHKPETRTFNLRSKSLE